MALDHDIVGGDPGEALGGQQRVQVAAGDVGLRVDVAECETRLRQGDRFEEGDVAWIVGIEDAAHGLTAEADRAEQVVVVDATEWIHVAAIRPWTGSSCQPT